MGNSLICIANWLKFPSYSPNFSLFLKYVGKNIKNDWIQKLVVIHIWKGCNKKLNNAFLSIFEIIHNKDNNVWLEYDIFNILSDCFKPSLRRKNEDFMTFFSYPFFTLSAPKNFDLIQAKIQSTVWRFAKLTACEWVGRYVHGGPRSRWGLDVQFLLWPDHKLLSEVSLCSRPWHCLCSWTGKSILAQTIKNVPFFWIDQANCFYQLQ